MPQAPSDVLYGASGPLEGSMGPSLGMPIPSGIERAHSLQAATDFSLEIKREARRGTAKYEQGPGQCEELRRLCKRDPGPHALYTSLHIPPLTCVRASSFTPKAT